MTFSSSSSSSSHSRSSFSSSFCLFKPGAFKVVSSCFSLFRSEAREEEEEGEEKGGEVRPLQGVISVPGALFRSSRAGFLYIYLYTLFSLSPRSKASTHGTQQREPETSTQADIQLGREREGKKKETDGDPSMEH